MSKVVGIIGGGVAGLQTGRALLAKGFRPVIFEKASDVGGVWRENYVGFGVQVPKQLYEFPDFPMTSVKTGDFPTGEQTQAYIKEYFKKNNLESITKLNTAVDRLSRREDGKPGWTVHASDKSKLDVDYCVVATGMYSSPSVPKYKGVEAFEQSGGKVLHSSQVLEAVKATDKVVITGCGKSAWDAALQASAHSPSVSVVVRRAHWGTPRKIMGLIPFQYVFLSRFGQGLVSVHAGVWPTEKPSSILRKLHRVLSKYITPPIFRLVEAIFSSQFGYTKATRPTTDVVFDFYGYGQVLGPDVKPLQKKATFVKDEIDHLGANSVILKSGKTIDANLVICATGFKKDYSYLPKDEEKRLNVESDGLYLYRQMLPVNVPDLAFVGSETATASNIATGHLQAHWLANYLQGNIKVSKKEMESEVDKFKNYKREWMPETSGRASLVLLHQIHYHDSLFRDMGMNPRRKGFLSEILMPYESCDLRVDS